MNKKTRELIELAFIFVGSGASIAAFFLSEIIKPNIGEATFIVISVILVGLGCFLLYLLGHKIYDIINTPWIICEHFPNEKRICKAVENCVTDVQIVKASGCNHLSQQTNRVNLFEDFLKLVERFIKYSNGKSKMTLPENPYNQINDNDKRKSLNRTLKMVKGKNNDKLVILEDTQLSAFRQNLYDDIKKNALPGKKIRKKSNFEQYISKHKEKDINIYWLQVHASHRGLKEDYIIINKSVCILSETSNPNHIKLIFSKKDIEDRDDLFQTLYKDTESYETLKFFEESIDIENLMEKDTTLTIDDRGKIQKYFEKMKKNL